MLLLDDAYFHRAAPIAATRTAMPTAMPAICCLVNALPDVVAALELDSCSGAAVASPAAIAHSIEVFGSVCGVAIVDDVEVGAAVILVVDGRGVADVDVSIPAVGAGIVVGCIVPFDVAACEVFDVETSVSVDDDDDVDLVVSAAVVTAVTAAAVVLHGPAPASNSLTVSPRDVRQNSPFPAAFPSVHRLSPAFCNNLKPLPTNAPPIKV